VIFAIEARACGLGRGRLGMRVRRYVIKSILICAWAAVGTGNNPAWGDGPALASFPRLMGMNIGAKNYQDAAYQKDLARVDVVILGFYRGWQPSGYASNATSAIRNAVQAIKAQNPDILVGQYTVLNETYDNPGDTATLDLRDKLHANKWWLLNAAGRKVQWTAEHSAWDINFTTWARPDSDGKRWPEWLAERNYATFFRDIPEFDMVYLDNVSSPPLLQAPADWNLDKVDEDRNDQRIVSAHHAGHLAHWKRIRELQPKSLLIGNANNDLAGAWKDQLDGAFLEAQMGESWSIETWAGWPAMMARYRAVLRNTRSPKIVGFNVSGGADDYRLFRYAYASCLLDDGYFSFTDKAKGYSSVPWFDEYNHKLGKALSVPPTAAWSQGVWRRDFQNGVVLVNPTSETRTVNVESGLRRLAGTQDPAVNSGSAVSQVSIRPKDGIVLRR
jgi:Hypothetical glycosyl hydrolase family 15